MLNQAWNHILNIKIIELNNKSFYKKSSELYKSCVEELKQRNISVNTGIIQSTLLRKCEKTFQQFFKKKRENGEQGFPKFKSSKYIEQSFEFKNQGISITDKYFQNNENEN